MMYAKLILRSARRSARDYLVYIVTLTICTTLFYAFLSVSSRFYKPDIGVEYNFTVLSDGMKVAICAVTLLLVFLIRFVNRYMLRSRQQEFALEAMMGMEQRTIGRLFFAETLIMGGVAVVLGIGLRAVCSQFITALLLTSYGRPYRPAWTLFPDTALWTAAVFLLIFLVVGLSNTRAIRRTKIIDMLSAGRRNEAPLQKSRWMQGVACLYLLLSVLMALNGGRMLYYYGDSRLPLPVQMQGVACLYLLLSVLMALNGGRMLYYYGDSRLPLPVQLMFWGNILIPACLLVWAAVWLLRRRKGGLPALVLGLTAGALLCALAAASVPVMQRRYALAFGGGGVNQALTFLLADLLFLLCGVVWLASSLLAEWKERSPAHRYQGEALFFFGQMISKLRTTSKTMTLTSITLVLAIFLFAAAPVLVGWAEGYLDVRSVYDVQIYSRYNDVYDEADLPSGDYDAVSRFLTENGIETTHDCLFSLYLPCRADFSNRYKYDFPVAAISLSDYNAVRATQGLAPITLGEGEFTTQWQAIATDEERDGFLQTHPTLATDAGTLTLAAESYYEANLGETLYNTYTDVVYILPDEACAQLLPVMRNRYIMTAQPLPYETARALESAFTADYPEQTADGVSYGIRLRTLQVNSARANNFVLQAAMLYGGVVLMVICLTILSLQQLLDAGQYRYRFSVLCRLGVEESHIRRLVLQQLGFWFGLPVGAAILVGAGAAGCFIAALRAEIEAYIGFGALAVQLGVTAAILAVLLGCYFVSTWVLFRRAVDA